MKSDLDLIIKKFLRKGGEALVKKQFKQAGFTMIELLVVIAIIGILASIALFSYNNVQEKAKDKAIISELSQVRTQAQVFYDDNGNSYTDFCLDQEYTRIETSMEGYDATGIDCADADEEWAVSVTLPSGGPWCVDATGDSTAIAKTTAGDTSCP